MKTPITTDLDPYFGSIDIKLWFFTLDGLGLLDSEVARREMDYYGLWDEANRARREQRAKCDRFVRHAVPHARYLEQASAAPEVASQPPSPPPQRGQNLSRAERRRRSRGR